MPKCFATRRPTGCGVAVVPVFIAEKELKSRALPIILADYHPPELSLYALYPATRYLEAKVRLFVDFSRPPHRVIRPMYRLTY